MSNARTLTVSDTVALAAIVTAAKQNAVIARVPKEYGEPIVGTARSIGDDRGNHAGDNEDIRDCSLRVTTRNGWDVFWPITELMDEVRSGMFVTNYES